MKVCVQSGGIIEYTGAKKCYELIEKAGFTGIDWNGLGRCLPGSVISKHEYKGKCILEQPLDAVLAHFAPEIEQIRKHGLIISQAHAPFPAYIPGHPEVLEYMIGIFNRAIEVCEHVGCKNLVIHGISLSCEDKVNTWECIDELNMHLYESLIPQLRKCTNVTVCLENLFTWVADHGAVEGTCSNPCQAVEYIDALNEKAGREAFGLCLDTGHLLVVKKDVRTYISMLGKRIKALHIHDNDGVSDRHFAPFTGKFMWDSFCEALHKAGYEGDLSFETFAQTRKVLKFDEELLLPWLTMIRQTGECFRKHIQG